MSKLKELLTRLWGNLMVRRTVHTFWQAFAAVFFVGVPLVVAALKAHGVAAGETALISLATASLAAGLSALRTGIMNIIQSRQV